MNYSKPFYSVYFNVADCGYDIRINDCPLQANRRRPVSSRMPINEWIHTGQNSLTARLYPLPYEEALRPDARLNVELYVREDDGDQSELVDRFVVGVARQTSAAGGPQEESNPPALVEPDGKGLKVSHAIPMTVPFDEWAWRSAPAIEASDDVRNQLLDELDKLHSLFATGDLDAVIQLCGERNYERSAALYLPVGEVVEMQRNSYRTLIEESGFTLQPAEKDDAILTVYGDGRLARLANRFGEATLFYADEKVTVIGQLTFMFRLDTQGNWIICR